MDGSVMTGAEALPDWVPEGAQRYLAHTEGGVSIREIARKAGCHASTVMRQIRKIETRRDDPLVDAALKSLGVGLEQRRTSSAVRPRKKEERVMASELAMYQARDDEKTIKDMQRVLRRLCERGAVLAVAPEMEKAVVVRESEAGASQRTAVVDRDVAETLALRDWIGAARTGRVMRYRITAAGRQALEEMFGADTVSDVSQTGMAEQHREWGEKTESDPETGQRRKFRYNLAESPLTALARRRDKDGAAFLSEPLVSAGERLREDFELAQMGPRVAQNWDRFLTGGARGGFSGDSGIGNGPEGARQRVADALAALGPGLGDVVLRCCCYLEGLETAEKRLGWSARSGKIVLRIALMQLRRHYEETTGPGGGMIG